MGTAGQSFQKTFVDHLSLITIFYFTSLLYFLFSAELCVTSRPIHEATETFQSKCGGSYNLQFRFSRHISRYRCRDQRILIDKFLVDDGCY